MCLLWGKNCMYSRLVRILYRSGAYLGGGCRRCAHPLPYPHPEKILDPPLDHPGRANSLRVSSVFVCILLYYIFFFFVESLFNNCFISLTFFQKLQPGKDCTSDSANLFHVSDCYAGGDVFVRLRSQRRGLKPAKRAYLAATVDTQPTPWFPASFFWLKNMILINVISWRLGWCINSY